MSWIKRLFARLRPKPTQALDKTFTSTQCDFTVDSRGFRVTYRGPHPKPALQMNWDAVSRLVFPERNRPNLRQTFRVESTGGQKEYLMDFNHFPRVVWEDLKTRISKLTNGRIRIDLPE